MMIIRWCLKRYYRAKRNTNLTQLPPTVLPPAPAPFLFFPKLFSSEDNGVNILAERGDRTTSVRA